MKTNMTLLRFACVSAVLVSLASTSANAQISSKPWLRMEPVKTQDEINKLNKDDTIAMVCTKCKTVQVTRLSDFDSKGRMKIMSTESVHACPGCGGQIQVRPGTKQTEMVHVCTKCGEDSAFCCATKKDSKPTKGMEKK